MNLPIWGEKKCDICSNGAYWYVPDIGLLCGVHSKKYKNRIELKKNQKALQALRNNKYKLHEDECDFIAYENIERGISGKLILTKFLMLKDPELVHGVINVYPNFRHGGRRDGIGLPQLSPKFIGPINHGQPGLPLALNLENFHQGNKVFKSELDTNGHPSKIFYDTRLEMYQSDNPKRHKDVALDDKGKRTNIPVFSIWIDKQGNEHRLSYFQSRQFYCTFYERACLDESCETGKAYKMLKEYIQYGYNLNIIGYDAYVIGNKTIEECYLDITRPFGHELVLYTLLVYPQNEWPWKKYTMFEF